MAKYSESEASFLASLYAKDHCGVFPGNPHQYHCYPLTPYMKHELVDGKWRGHWEYPVSRTECGAYRQAKADLLNLEKPTKSVASGNQAADN
jgi:hypothetical protein